MSIIVLVITEININEDSLSDDNIAENSNGLNQPSVNPLKR